jgi:predicted dehydrogenase
MRIFRLLLLSAVFLVTSRAGAQGGAPRSAAPLRLGVVGLTHSHVHGLLGRKGPADIVIVGIVEKNRDLARRYTQRYGLSMDLVYDSVDEMLEKS